MRAMGGGPVVRCQMQIPAGPHRVVAHVKEFATAPSCPFIQRDLRLSGSATSRLHHVSVAEETRIKLKVTEDRATIA
jgi:hypothetical protein